MLYVSRMLSRSQVCVVDTDDGVEEILNGGELVRCLRDYGLEIKGVTLHNKNGRFSVTATPCQPDDTISTFQVKQKLLRGVDVKVSGDIITSIQWTDSVPQPVSVRLSDFGTKCADYLFWWEGLCTNEKLTLIFDDKMSATSKSLKFLSVLRVKVDLREVTNDKLARLIYKAFGESYKGRYLSGTDYPFYIIDNEERLKFWQAVYSLNHSVIGVASVAKLCEYPGVAERIYKEFGTEFRALAKCPFTLVHTHDSHFRCRSYIRNILDVADETDYTTLFYHCFPQVLNILEAHSTLKKDSIVRFRNYLHYFSNIPDDMKEAFATLCFTANDYLYNEYMEGGLR